MNWAQVKLRGRGAGPVLPWGTLRPPPFPTHCLWVLPGLYNSQSKHANADCAQFVFPFMLFSILSSIILWLEAY